MSPSLSLVYLIQVQSIGKGNTEYWNKHRTKNMYIAQIERGKVIFQFVEKVLGRPNTTSGDRGQALNWRWGGKDWNSKLTNLDLLRVHKHICKVWFF